MDFECDFLQIFWSMVHRIHPCHNGKQCLRCTNIGSCFFSFYVLFPGLKCHPVCRPVILIFTEPDNPPRQSSFKFLLASQVCCMRTTEADRDPKSLRRSHCRSEEHTTELHSHGHLVC